uniref:Gypsy retrotransposon integrase-like protein 1 n=1 Tax=Xenopus tropicalis TaxID=8364 RepID=A0A803KCS2_XENTR
MDASTSGNYLDLTAHELSELRLPTLQRLCHRWGIDPEGKRRHELMELLTPHAQPTQEGDTQGDPETPEGGEEMCNLHQDAAEGGEDSTLTMFHKHLAAIGPGLSPAERLEVWRLTLQANQPGPLSSGPAVGSPNAQRRVVKLTHAAFPTFDESKQSIDGFLRSFEGLCEDHRVPQEEWVLILAGKLTGKANEVYQEIPYPQRANYGEVRRILLASYSITPDSYRRTFRSLVKIPQDTYQNFGGKLQRAFRHWIRGNKTHTLEDLCQLILKEQFLERCPTEVREWVSDRKPGTLDEATQLADEYIENRSQARPLTLASGTMVNTRGLDRPQPPRLNHLPNRTLSAPTRAATPRTCFRCGSLAHLSPACPLNLRPAPPGPTGRLSAPRQVAAVSSPGPNIRQQVIQTVRQLTTDPAVAPPRPREDVIEEYVVLGMGWDNSGQPRKHVLPVRINGRQVEGFLDSGSFITLVEPHIVSADAVIPGKTARIVLAGGHKQDIPIAQVTLDLGHGPFTHRVGILRQLPAEILLGNDVGHIECSLSRDTNEVNTVSMDAPQGVREPAADCDSPPTPDLLHPTTFREAQHTDPTLECIRIKAGKPPNERGEQIVWERGLLYRIVKGNPNQPWKCSRQLIVPLSYRAQLLHMAHEIPLAGHQGVTRTRHRLTQNFYWPGISQEVTRYCRTCDSCQRTGRANDKPKFPLCPLPIISEPFQRVAVDLIGPLSRPSRSGKQYILTVMDYATRYPEAVALRKIDAPTVADALIQIFSRVGFPSEILSDQGPQFTSQLLQCLWQRCGVRAIHSSPYHPQTNGLCERFNGTLKTMLRTFVESGEKDWERYLPHLLFAYREVPQESTGFSPFELLYGRRVRGPLDLLCEYWEGAPQSQEVPIIPYVLKFRQRLEQMTSLAHDHLSAAQQRQKVWYDRKARERRFMEGDKVLLLVPTRHDKLQAAWEGPYVVTHKLHDTTYVVTPPEDPSHYKTVHINMMKPYHIREDIVSAICSAPVEGTDDPPIPNLIEEATSARGIDAVTISDHLHLSQQDQLRKILRSYSPMFSANPGRTHWAEHKVDTGTQLPIRSPAYRVAEAVRPEMKSQIDEMLAFGVITPSHSPWASPVVLVPKKDGSTRFCVDYRRLNDVTTTDAYPMPRVDELLDRLGNAKYLTTLDLSRGYWQIPLAPSAQEKSAFLTPFGLYQFTVMPFGMRNAPATFQRLVNRLLEGMQDFAQAYLDDIAVFSQTWEEHLQHLQRVFAQIQDAGLTLKPEKCHLAMAEVQYLGHRVGGGQLRPDPAKVEAICQWPIPKTQKQVLAFLGTSGYYRKFIPNYSTVAKPLTDLTSRQRSRTIVWTPECESAMNALKQALASSPVLAAPDFSRRFILQTDASNFGLGAVLSQVNTYGEEHPVAYLSRKLLPREAAYATIEKECLAIVWALQKLQPYLYGREFTVVTDHNPLSWLQRVSGDNGKLLRWSLLLQQYNFTIQHRKGKEHHNADGLSRQED